MKKAFVAVGYEASETEWSRVCILSHSTFRPYAEKHGYDFILTQRADLKPEWWKVCADRTHPYWLKIPAILQALEKYDAVVYMDSDCLILNDAADILDTMPQGKDLAMADVDGYGGKVVSTAVSVTRNSSAGFGFWNEVWCSEAYERTGWADNANVANALGYCLHPPWQKIRHTSYDSHYHDLGVMWNAYTIHGGEYIPGCVVYHASGSGNPTQKLAWMNTASGKQKERNMTKGTRKKVCKYGHAMVGANVKIIKKTLKGKKIEERACATCYKERYSDIEEKA